MSLGKREKVCIGGTWQQFQDYCFREKLNPQKQRFITQVWQLQGLELRSSQIVRLGPVTEQFEVYLKTRIRR